MAESKSVAANRERGRPTIAGFYDAALSEAEREALPFAREIRGIDEEIAVLRLRLRSALTDHPEKLSLMVKGVGLLAKALSTRYQLTKDDRSVIADAIRQVLDEFDKSVCVEVNSGNAGNGDG